jgi:hypothetical protein
VSDATIARGLLDPLARMGFGVSAGIETSDGTRLFAIFEVRSRRIMIVAHPARSGNMTAIALAPWTSARPPLAGDLLDELIDPRNMDAIRTALSLLRDGSL